MIVYRDIISEDEVLSDAFKLSPVVDKDGAVVRIMIQILWCDDINALSNSWISSYDKKVTRIWHYHPLCHCRLRVLWCANPRWSAKTMTRLMLAVAMPSVARVLRMQVGYISVKYVFQILLISFDYMKYHTRWIKKHFLLRAHRFRWCWYCCHG